MMLFFIIWLGLKVKTLRPVMSLSSPVWGFAPHARPLGSDGKIAEAGYFYIFASFQSDLHNFERPLDDLTVIVSLLGRPCLCWIRWLAPQVLNILLTARGASPLRLDLPSKGYRRESQQ